MTVEANTSAWNWVIGVGVSSKVSVEEFEFTTAKSGLPSPLKSAAGQPRGTIADDISSRLAKCSGPAAAEHEEIVREIVHHCQVGLVIAVPVDD